MNRGIGASSGVKEMVRLICGHNDFTHDIVRLSKIRVVLFDSSDKRHAYAYYKSQPFPFAVYLHIT